MWIALAAVLGFLARGLVAKDYNWRNELAKVHDNYKDDAVNAQFTIATLRTRQAQARRVLQPLMRLGVAAGFAPKKWVQYALDWLNTEDR